jgi:hypothetical protein
MLSTIGETTKESTSEKICGIIFVYGAEAKE